MPPFNPLILARRSSPVAAILALRFSRRRRAVRWFGVSFSGASLLVVVAVSAMFVVARGVVPLCVFRHVTLSVGASWIASGKWDA